MSVDVEIAGYFAGNGINDALNPEYVIDIDTTNGIQDYELDAIVRRRVMDDHNGDGFIDRNDLTPADLAALKHDTGTVGDNGQTKDLPGLIANDLALAVEVSLRSWRIPPAPFREWLKRCSGSPMRLYVPWNMGSRA